MTIQDLEYIQHLERELKAAKRERDAAVMDLNFTTPCEVCMNNKGCPGWPRHNPCQWQWRGVCSENTEVQGDG